MVERKFVLFPSGILYEVVETFADQLVRCCNFSGVGNVHIDGDCTYNGRLYVDIGDSRIWCVVTYNQLLADKLAGKDVRVVARDG